MAARINYFLNLWVLHLGRVCFYTYIAPHAAPTAAGLLKSLWISSSFHDVILTWTKPNHTFLSFIRFLQIKQKSYKSYLGLGLGLSHSAMKWAAPEPAIINSDHGRTASPCVAKAPPTPAITDRWPPTVFTPSPHSFHHSSFLLFFCTSS